MDQTCSLESFLNHVQKRDPHQTEFAQAVREVMTTLWPFLEQNPPLPPHVFTGTFG